jgi:hypothetical protein
MHSLQCLHALSDSLLAELTPVSAIYRAPVRYIPPSRCTWAAWRLATCGRARYCGKRSTASISAASTQSLSRFTLALVTRSRVTWAQGSSRRSCGDIHPRKVELWSENRSECKFRHALGDSFGCGRCSRDQNSFESVICRRYGYGPAYVNGYAYSLCHTDSLYILARVYKKHPDSAHSAQFA